MNLHAPTILLAEDDENDIFFLKRALQKAEVTLPLHIVTNGQETVDYLSGTGKFGNRDQYPLPSILFLDLKMPFLDGFEVLAWLNAQPSLKGIPAMILTSSAEERDRDKAAMLGARGYFVKPPNPEMVKQMLQSATALPVQRSVSA